MAKKEKLQYLRTSFSLFNNKFIIKRVKLNLAYTEHKLGVRNGTNGALGKIFTSTNNYCIKFFQRANVSQNKVRCYSDSNGYWRCTNAKDFYSYNFNNRNLANVPFNDLYGSDDNSSLKVPNPVFSLEAHHDDIKTASDFVNKHRAFIGTLDSIGKFVEDNIDQNLGRFIKTRSRFVWIQDRNLDSLDFDKFQYCVSNLNSRAEHDDNLVMDFDSYSHVLFVLKKYPMLMGNDIILKQAILHSTVHYMETFGMDKYNDVLKKAGVISKDVRITDFQGDFNNRLDSEEWIHRFASRFVSKLDNANLVVDTVNTPLLPIEGSEWTPVMGRRGFDGYVTRENGVKSYYEHGSFKLPTSTFAEGKPYNSDYKSIILARYHVKNNKTVMHTIEGKPQIEEISKGAAVSDGAQDVVKKFNQKGGNLPKGPIENAVKGPSIVIIDAEHSHHHSASINDAVKFLSSTDNDVIASAQFKYFYNLFSKFGWTFDPRSSSDSMYCFKNRRMGLEGFVRVNPKATYCTPQELANDPGVFDNYNKAQINKNKKNLNKNKDTLNKDDNS